MHFVNVIFPALLLFYSGNYVIAKKFVEESTLYETLLSNYDKYVSPRTHKEKKINITVNLILMSFQGLDERNGILQSGCIATTQWNDNRLRWDPYFHGNVTVLLIDKNEIWSPKLTLGNPATQYERIGELVAQTYVTYSGSVLWEFGYMFYSTCDIDVAFFPFDTQNCFIDLFPFGMQKNDFKLYAEEIDKSIYLENNVWVLTETSVETIKVKGRWNARYWLSLERRCTFYILNLFSPVLMILYLNTMVYVLPADSGERVGYAITCLLSLSVYMTFASEGLPESSKPLPVITIVLLTYVAISALISLTTIVGLRFHLNDNSRTPPRILLKILCVSRKSFCVKSKISDLSETEETQATENDYELEEGGRITSWKDLANKVDTLCFFSSNVCVFPITIAYFIIVRTYA